VFLRRRWFKGAPHVPGALADIAWFRPDGQEMPERDWGEWFAKSFMLFLNGDALRSTDAEGRPVHDDTFLLLCNSHVDPVSFTLIGQPWGDRWTSVLTTEGGVVVTPEASAGGAALERPGLSMQVFRRESQ
jgi:isoamylase